MSETSVKRLAIEFDHENETYMPGELVSGKVLAEFTRPKQVRGLQIRITGESVVKWSAQSEKPDVDGNYHREVLTSREDYFCLRFYLLGSQSGSTINLPLGQSVYPFNFQLPMNLPSSFEHSYGYVRYTVKAIFDRPWKFDHEVKTAFTVVSPFDLNRRPEASLAIREETDKNFCCFCICPNGKIYATMLVPLSGFAPGQVIPVTIECNNESSNEIEKIKASLRQKVKFHATTPRWSTKEDEIMVAEAKSIAPFTNNSEDHVTIQLKVPPLPPSSLEYCGLIDLDYDLRVVICFSGMHCSIERRFPILIGTIPLYSSSNLQNSNTVLPPPPTAPSLQELPPNITMPQPIGVSQSTLGFVVPNQPYPFTEDPNNLLPPSYEECIQRAPSIRDKEESEYVYGARIPFAPRYPVYNTTTANTFPSLPESRKD